MKSSASIFFLALLLGVISALGQSPGSDTTLPDAPPPGNTIITSDELRMDQDSHTALFTGNVVVVGNQFNMTCQEMTVTFDNNNKLLTILAKGQVVITQPGRIAHCGQALYYHDEDKFVLTDQPSIIDNKNQIFAPMITIYRTQQSMVTKGRTKTILIQSPSATSSPAKIK